MSGGKKAGERDGHRRPHVPKPPTRPIIGVARRPTRPQRQFCSASAKLVAFRIQSVIFYKTQWGRGKLPTAEIVRHRANMSRQDGSSTNALAARWCPALRAVMGLRVVASQVLSPLARLLENETGRQASSSKLPRPISNCKWPCSMPVSRSIQGFNMRGGWALMRACMRLSQSGKTR